MTTDGRPVLLVGASGLAREVLPLLAEEGRTVLGVLDDRYADLPPVLPPPYDHVPVLGPVSSAPDHPDAALLLCVGPERGTAPRCRTGSGRARGSRPSSTRRCATPPGAPSGPVPSSWPV